MTVYRNDRDGRWRYRSVVTLADGTMRRVCGSAPSAMNTKLGALAAEREHVRRIATIDTIETHLPGTTTRTPSPTPPPPRDLGSDEYERMIGAALNEGEPWATAVLLAGEADLRIGEVLALEWTDCDLVANTISVSRHMSRNVIVPSKCSEPRRVPITPRLAAHLRGMPRNHAHRVAASVDGVPVTEGLAKRVIHRLYRAAGLLERSWSALRRSWRAPHSSPTHL